MWHKCHTFMLFECIMWHGVENSVHIPHGDHKKMALYTPSMVQKPSSGRRGGFMFFIHMQRYQLYFSAGNDQGASRGIDHVTLCTSHATEHEISSKNESAKK